MLIESEAECAGIRRKAEASPEPVANLQGVTLAHAVRIIMQDWPLQHRKDALIATEREFLRFTDIRAIFTRPDFPKHGR